MIIDVKCRHEKLFSLFKQERSVFNRIFILAFQFSYGVTGGTKGFRAFPVTSTLRI